MKLTNLWWALLPWLQSIIQPKGTTSLSITAYKQEEDWHFNNLSMLTCAESFVVNWGACPYTYL